MLRQQTPEIIKELFGNLSPNQIVHDYDYYDNRYTPPVYCCLSFKDNMLAFAGKFLLRNGVFIGQTNAPNLVPVASISGNLDIYTGPDENRGCLVLNQERYFIEDYDSDILPVAWIEPDNPNVDFLETCKYILNDEIKSMYSVDHTSDIPENLEIQYNENNRFDSTDITLSIEILGNP